MQKAADEPENTEAGEDGWEAAVAFYTRELTPGEDWRPVMSYGGRPLAEPGKYWVNRGGLLVNTHSKRDARGRFHVLRQYLRKCRGKRKNAMVCSYYYIWDGGKKKAWEFDRLQREVFGSAPDAKDRENG